MCTYSIIVYTLPDGTKVEKSVHKGEKYYDKFHVILQVKTSHFFVDQST